VTHARGIYRDAGRLEPHRGLAASVPSSWGESPGLLYFDEARRLLRQVVSGANPSRLLHDQGRGLVGVVVSPSDYQ
jgi:hypothetical protein